MKPIHNPTIDARYWVAIAMASVFGTNLGDLFAHESGLGILGGLPILAAILAAAWFFERRDVRPHEAWYWLAIIVIRTGATNIADYLCGRRYVGLDRFALSAGLAVVIAVLAWSSTRPSGTRERLPQTDTRYWLAMLCAGVLGTALGDALQHAMGSGVATLGLTVLLAATILLRSRVAGIAGYWLAVCIARTAGTAVGDYLAESRDLNIGLTACTIATGVVFLAVLVAWRSGNSPAANSGR